MLRSCSLAIAVIVGLVACDSSSDAGTNGLGITITSNEVGVLSEDSFVIGTKSRFLVFPERNSFVFIVNDSLINRYSDDGMLLNSFNFNSLDADTLIAEHVAPNHPDRIYTDRFFSMYNLPRVAVSSAYCENGRYYAVLRIQSSHHTVEAENLVTTEEVTILCRLDEQLQPVKFYLIPRVVYEGNLMYTPFSPSLVTINGRPIVPVKFDKQHLEELQGTEVPLARQLSTMEGDIEMPYLHATMTNKPAHVNQQTTLFYQGQLFGYSKPDGKTWLSDGFMLEEIDGGKSVDQLRIEEPETDEWGLHFSIVGDSIIFYQRIDKDEDEISSYLMVKRLSDGTLMDSIRLPQLYTRLGFLDTKAIGLMEKEDDLTIHQYDIEFH